MPSGGGGSGAALVAVVAWMILGPVSAAGRDGRGDRGQDVYGDAGSDEGEGRDRHGRSHRHEGHGAGRERLRPDRLRGEAHGDAQAEEHVDESDRPPASGGSSGTSTRRDSPSSSRTRGPSRLSNSPRTAAASRLDPGQEAIQSLDVDFPAEALKAKKLKEIRLEFAYIPSPYREETVNFIVAVGEGK